MGMDDDYALALKLQQQFENEFVPNNENEVVFIPPASPVHKLKTLQSEKNKTSASTSVDLNRTANIVDPEWEVIDPTPDIFALFGAFDVKFFQGKLKCVSLEWSKKMYSCAGICYQRKNSLGSACTIRLSEPLLKLRPRKNLIETLLHEMIHAYLFILNIREANGGHGPNFHKIMHNINRTAGTNITVYHTFHDEVNLYKTHVWRCNGICQHRKPFFGYVRRTANRAPGPNDLWWQQHQVSCGGYFEKVSAPEPKRKPKVAASASKPIKVVDDRQKINSPLWGFNKTSTISTSTPITPKQISPKPKIGNLTNVVGFKNLTETSTTKRPAVPTFTSGSGFVLGQSTNGIKTPSRSSGGASVVDNVRDCWSKKFADAPPEPKKAKIEFKSSTAEWEKIDDEIHVMDKRPSVIILKDSDDEDDVQELPSHNRTKIIKQSSEDRRKTIKQEIIDSNVSDCDDDDNGGGGGNESDIELIDDEFDDNINAAISSTLVDNHVINDIFGTDTLMADFNEINDAIKKDDEYYGQTNKEIIQCPICQERMQREQLNDHLDGCLGITAKINVKPPSYSSGNARKRKLIETNSIAAATSTAQRTDRQMLIDFGYDESVVDKIIKDQAEEKAYNDRILREMSENGDVVPQAPSVVEEEKLPCPVCQGLIETTKINDHLDVCLTNN